MHAQEDVDGRRLGFVEHPRRDREDIVKKAVPVPVLRRAPHVADNPVPDPEQSGEVPRVLRGRPGRHLPHRRRLHHAAVPRADVVEDPLPRRLVQPVPVEDSLGERQRCLSAGLGLGTA